MNWLYVLIGAGIFGAGFLIEPVRDFYEMIWEYVSDGLTYIISFDWLSDIGEVFSNAWEAVTNIGDSPLINVWFWIFYIFLMAGVWYLPNAMGVIDYTFNEKIIYTIIFFVVDWVIVSHISNS